MLCHPIKKLLFTVEKYVKKCYDIKLQMSNTIKLTEEKTKEIVSYGVKLWKLTYISIKKKLLEGAKHNYQSYFMHNYM